MPDKKTYALAFFVMGNLAVNHMGSFVSQVQKDLNTVMFPIYAINYWTSIITSVISMIKIEF